MGKVECIKCGRKIIVYYIVMNKSKYVCDNCVKKSIDYDSQIHGKVKSC